MARRRVSNASRCREDCDDHEDREIELSGPCETLGFFKKSSGMSAFDDIALHGRECTESVVDVMRSDFLPLASLDGMVKGLEMEVCFLLRGGEWKFADVGLNKADVLERMAREIGMPDDLGAVISLEKVRFWILWDAAVASQGR